MKFSSSVPFLLAIAALALASSSCSNPPEVDDGDIKADSTRRADSLHRVDSLHHADSLRQVDSLHQVDSLQKDHGLREILCDLSANVYLSAAVDLEKHVAFMASAITDFTISRNADDLLSAREAWIHARRPWEFSEMALFGPAKGMQLDPSIDSWPVDIVAIEEILKDHHPIDGSFLESREGTVRGFHAIEYLLWGENGRKQVGDFTEREYQYLRAAAQFIQSDAARLREAWVGKEGDIRTSYAWQLCHAGESGSLYYSVSSAITSITTAAISLTAEMGDAKMGIPYHSPDNGFEESRFSNTTRTDFIANLEGIRAWYTGEYYNGTVHVVGHGITEFVTGKDPKLDAKVRQEIEDAIRRVSEIQPSFTDAVLQRNGGSKLTIAYAITAMQSLQATLEQEVLPLLQ